MKALLFADLHASCKQLQNIRAFVSEKQNDIGLLIFAGDLVNMGEPVGFAQQFMQTIDEIGLPFVWVPGNNDFGRSYYKIKAKYPSLEGKMVEYHGLKFSGVGGSPASWAGQYAGENMIDRKKIGGSIFISHFPPPGVRTYSKYDDSPAFKNPRPNHNIEKNNSLIENYKLKIENSSGPRLSDAPLVHICAHLHHRWGVSYLGNTKIIQLAATELGYYATMDLDTMKVEFGRFKDKVELGVTN